MLVQQTTPISNILIPRPAPHLREPKRAHVFQGQRYSLAILHFNRVIPDKIKLIPPPKGARTQRERHLENVLVFLHFAGGVGGDGVLLGEVRDVDGVAGEGPVADVEALKCGMDV